MSEENNTELDFESGFEFEQDEKAKKDGRFAGTLYLDNVRLAFSKNCEKLFEMDHDVENDRKFWAGNFIISDHVREEVNDFIDSAYSYLPERKEDDFDHCFLKDGDDMTPKDSDEPYDGFKGLLYADIKKQEATAAGRKNEPPAVYDQAGKLVEEFDKDRLFRDGCLVDVSCYVFAINKSKKNYILGASLTAVVMVDEGKPFSSGRNDSTLLNRRKRKRVHAKPQREDSEESTDYTEEAPRKSRRKSRR